MKPTGSGLFIFSMSEQRDDLSQWRGYARDGKGFVIGFDADALYQGSTDQSNDFTFVKVQYEHATQQKILEKITKELADQLIKEIAANPKLPKKDIVTEAARTLSWTVRNCRGFNKHRTFKAEAEWRLTTIANETSGRIAVRTRNLDLIPYVSLQPTGSNTKLPIKSIGIGPGFENPEISDAVRALCRRTGYDPEIWSAESPYRRG